MSRGSNEAFQNRVGRLSIPLQIKNIRARIKSCNPELDAESIDVRSLVDSDLSYGENLSRVKEAYPLLFDDKYQTIESELERYRHLWDEFEERHDIGE